MGTARLRFQNTFKTFAYLVSLQYQVLRQL